MPKNKPIAVKPSHRGLLHKDLGIPEGKPIPLSDVGKAEKSKDPAERKRAVFAATARKWGK